MTALLAAQAPFWEPGTAPGYHALTQGYLVGEVVRRITGRSRWARSSARRSPSRWAPTSTSACRRRRTHRVAELIPPPPGAAPSPTPDRAAGQHVDQPRLDVSATRTRAWRGAEIPAAGGTGNARSVAEVHAILANGGVAEGRRFMSEAGCRRALELQVEGRDLILDLPLRFGLGFAARAAG